MHPLQHLSTGDCVGSLAELNLSSCIHITDQGLDLLLAASPPRLAILVVHRSTLMIGCSCSINTNTAATVSILILALSINTNTCPSLHWSAYRCPQLTEAASEIIFQFLDQQQSSSRKQFKQLSWTIH